MHNALENQRAGAISLSTDDKMMVCCLGYYKGTSANRSSQSKPSDDVDKIDNNELGQTQGQ